jgi:molybdopterin-guanine dinucleotide biosynthesis protein A
MTNPMSSMPDLKGSVVAAPSQTIDAIIPAGGTNKPEFAAACGSDTKALIKFGETTLLERVVNAVKNAPSIRRVVVIGSEKIQPIVEGLGCFFVSEGSSGPDNIFLGLAFLASQNDPPSHALIATVDLPFIKSEHVEWFVQHLKSSKDIYVPIVRESDFLALYPGCPSTFVKMKNDQFTLGGLFLYDVPVLRRVQPHIERIFEQRKSLFGMAKLVGLGFAFKLLTKQLVIQDVEDKVESILSCTGSAVLGTPAELAFDVDDNEDYSYGIEWLKKNSA